MLRVFVLDKNHNPLMPCHSARARELLSTGKARVLKRVPFTIVLINREEGAVQPVEVKVDPGSKTSGIALVADAKRGKKVAFAINLEHRGHAIKESLDKRRAIRRSRRARKTRYRAPRFDNRRRGKDWLPPSLQSRVDNVVHWVNRIKAAAPVTAVAVETVRFDTQKIRNPEISGIEYQQGELLGYEIREYLLEKWQRTCAYCGKKALPLQFDHIHPRSRGGTDSITNLTLACSPCNQRKSNQSVKDFLQDEVKLNKLLDRAKAPLKDAAAVNATRYVLGNSLKKLGLPLSFWSGGRTKKNRVSQGYAKDHWIDAACVGETGEQVSIRPNVRCLLIKAQGRGSRQMCRMDRYGFPRTGAKAEKRVFGFQTGDLVKAVVTKGKKQGVYIGRVAVRSTGNFNISVEGGVVQGIHHRYCRLIQRNDGYSYAYMTVNTQGGSSSP
jgi:5-methylcytosine-specific restriction endonuclease McrA